MPVIKSDFGSAQAELVNKILKTNIPPEVLIDFTCKFLGCENMNSIANVLEFDSVNTSVVWNDVTLNVFLTLLAKKLIFVSN